MRKHFYFIIVVLLISGCTALKEVFPPTKEEVLKNPNFKWEKDSTQNFVLYYQPNSSAIKSMTYIKSFLEDGKEKILKLMKEKTYYPKITFFILGSRDQMKDIFGYETNGKAISKDNSVYSVIGKKINALALHEFTHVITDNLWKQSVDEWTSEGFAVYSDDNWWGNNLHALSNYLLQKNKLFSITELTNSFRKFDNKITFPQAGSFIKYIYENHGLNAVMTIWKEGNDSIRKATGKTLKDLEQEWLLEIRKHNASNINYPI